MSKVSSKSTYENVISHSDSRTSKHTKLFTIKDESGGMPTGLSLSNKRFPVNIKKQETILDILKIHDDNLLTNDQNAPVHDRIALANSMTYHPLEEMSLANVFYYDESFFCSKFKSSCTELDQESLAPSEFQLSGVDPTVTKIVFNTVTITLSETETIILFELPQRVDDVRTMSGTTVDNEQYEHLASGNHVHRQTINSDTQTINIGVKNCYTQLSKTSRNNQGSYVNTWITFDAYKMQEINLQTNTIEQEAAHFSQKTKPDNIEEQLHHIYYNTRFQKDVRIILRILASNVYEVPQKLFKGLIKEDITNPNRKFTYDLKLLWTYTTEFVKYRIVSSFAWNHVNNDLLAVSYGPFLKSDTDNDNLDTKGLLLIWCAKNPENPEYCFEFDSPISALDWSKSKPHWMAIGFYNGQVQVIDVSGQTLTVVRKSSIINLASSYKSHWNVQWWYNDKNDNETSELLNSVDYFENEIYTANQDGRILCFSLEKDFEATEITRINKIEKQNDCIKRICDQEIPVFEYSAALLLQRHPTVNLEYFVGSEDGYIYRFTKNELQRPVDSFYAHDGAVHSLEFSPFSPEIFVTSGADSYIRIWCDKISEPLIMLSTRKGVVRSVVWSPTNSTILANIVDNQICIWNLASKTYEPMSVTYSPGENFYSLKFMPNGKQLVVSDISGNVFIFHLQGMPVANYNHRNTLLKFIEENMALKPDLMREFKTKINISEKLGII